VRLLRPLGVSGRLRVGGSPEYAVQSLLRKDAGMSKTLTDPASAAIAYRQQLNAIMHAQTLHEAKQLASKALEIQFARATGSEISIVGGFGVNSRQPYVAISTPNPVNQIAIEAAREIAQNILSEAAIAEADGALFTFFQDEMHFELREIAGLIAQLRDYRARFRADLDHEPSPPDVPPTPSA
jgi:hypothetical protein